MTTAIAELLAQLDAPGTFATRLRASAGDLEITVKDVGRLSFPITPRIAQKLRSVARPSPFGLGEKTLHDPTVRNTWEVAASRVKISAQPWKPALKAHLAALHDELGFPDGCELHAEFDKLLLYEKGAFFKTHQDSEKSDDMVATLVVVLPSEYSGGSLIVEHGGKKKTFPRLKSQSTDLSLLAFYADCHHEVRPVSKGVRVALTYRLSLHGRSSGASMKGHAKVIERLTERVREHFATPTTRMFQRTEPVPPERLVYLLDHEYTQRSLSFSHLKNGDRVRGAALQMSASSLDCECVLALAEVHETWGCADESPRGRYGRRHWDDHDDDHDDEPNDSGDHELIDLCNSTVELQHWVDADGYVVEGTRADVETEELCVTKPSVDFDPFKSQHEGYQGNYGNTVDRWYQRAALVMWPRANSFALSAQASPQRAVEQLLARSRATADELEATVSTLLPRWATTTRSVEGAGTAFFAKVIKLATRFNNADIAHRWLVPLGAHRLQHQATRRDLTLLVQKHGVSWAKTLFTEWMRSAWDRSPAWLPALADVCEELRATKHASCEEFAEWLLERELTGALDECSAAMKREREWLALDGFEHAATHLTHVLAAAVAVGDLDVVERSIAFLLSVKIGAPVSLLVQVFQASLARSPKLRAQLTGSPLHRSCLDRLESILRATPRAANDWRIVCAQFCNCPDCKHLIAFLGSQHESLDWPLNKDRRQHIHQAIDSAKLPVSHTTLRHGSPHVLQLRKLKALFARETAYRKQVQVVLRALPAGAIALT